MSKLPEPKEWWRSRVNDDTAFICGFDFEGCPVFQTDEVSPARIDTMDGFLKDWYWEPRCTSFNMVKESGCADIQDKPIFLNNKQLDKLMAMLNEPVKSKVWPKYFVPVNPDHEVIIGNHYYRIDSSELGWCVDRGFDSYRINCKEIMSNPDLWKEVTEAEAKAIKPIELPGNLVTQDKVPVTSGWLEHFAARTTDIKSISLKLWTTYRILDEGGDWPVRVTNANDTCQNWIEVKIGPNGFYTDVKQ